MVKYDTKFIPQNKAPINSDYVYVYNGIKLTGKIKIGDLKIPPLGNKLYSFGALSDVHASVVARNLSTNNVLNGESRFKAALNYFEKVEKVDFICIAGDLTGEGMVNNVTDQFLLYKNCIAVAAPNTPVYEVTGNHDLQTPPITPFTAPVTYLKNYTGHVLYYTVSNKPTIEDYENENYNYYNKAISDSDIFLMFGMSGWWGHTNTETFSERSMEWLYKVLEENRNKRCFLFTHPPRFDGSGVPYGIAPTGNLLNGDLGNNFKKLISSYTNVIYFHGHTHITFNSQNDCEYANYDRMYGCHSIHIPTTLNVKTINAAKDGYDTTDESLGYVVDVYENHIVLRGVDFIWEKLLPVATYCLDTTPQQDV